MKKICKEVCKNIWRFPYRTYLKLKLKNHDFSIISANCIGAVLTHDLKEQFRSPTVNLTITNFLKFVQNLEYYIQSTPPEINGYHKEGYPICNIEDIQLNGVHYYDHKELIDAWQKRKARINWDNIFIIATDEFIKTDKELIEFSKLPYPKVLFVSYPKTKYDFQIYIPYYKEQGRLGDLNKYCDLIGRRVFEKYFDCVGWLNHYHK